MENADLGNFQYYYDRMKKMTLLRKYASLGLDMRFLYDPDELFDLKKKQKQEEKKSFIETSINKTKEEID